MKNLIAMFNKDINKIIALVSLIFIAPQLDAQQLPVYNQYMFNQFVLNPAMSSVGVEVPTITAIHRNQWVGVDGAPETSLITFNGDIVERNVGYAAYLYRDQTGILSTTSFYGNYSYNFLAFDGFRIALGLSAGVVYKGVDRSKINLPNSADPILATNIGNGSTFDFNFGVNFNYWNFDLGFAAPQLFGNSINSSEALRDSSMSFNLERHYVGVLRYTYNLSIPYIGQFGDRAKIIPQLTTRYLPNSPVQFDLHTTLELEDLGWLGVGYRTNMGIISTVGFDVTNDLAIGYSYEMNLGATSKSLGSSHEITLVYRLGGNKRLNDRLQLELEQMRTEELELMELMEEDMIRRQDSIAQRLQNDIVLIDNKLEERTDLFRRELGEAPVEEDDLSTTASNVVAGSKGFYIVANVFAYWKNAENMVKNLSDEGYDVDYFYHKANKFYYVFLRKYKTYESALKIKQNNINGTYFDEIWIKEVK
jgi:type IX secretion system PorP/SprF family membrane protein